jgi:DNA-binding CsgD family transcriptional regulator
MTAVFGRDLELAAVNALMESATEGPALLQIEGEPGIGKTTVWEAGLATAAELGMQLLVSRPAQAEATLTFAALADLLTAVDTATLRALPAPQRHALEVALLRASPGQTPPDPRAVATGVLSLLERLGASQPLLVAVDDVQWLDSASAAALAFAIRRVGNDCPVSVLTTARVESGRALDPLGLEPLGPEGRSRLRLGPLELAALHDLVDARLEVSFPRPVLQRIEQESGGNPLFALELGRALRDSGLRPGPGEPLPLHHGFRELLEARSAQLQPAARGALLAVALMGQPSDALVERVVGDPAELDAAIEAGLLERRDGRPRFTHPLYAAALESAASAEERRALHERLAAAVGDPEERARHLAAATEGADERVARELEAGAAVATSRGAWVSAAELLERACDLTPDSAPEVAARRAIAAAEHHVHAGDRGRGREVVEAVLAGKPAPALRADALRVLGEISYNDENFFEALRLFEEALEDAGHTRTAVLVELGLSYVWSNLMDWETANRHAARAYALAEELGQWPHAARALAYTAMMDFLTGNGVDWPRVDRALALEDRSALQPLVQSPRTIQAFLLLYTGQHEAARERFRAFSAEARERGDESDLAFVMLWSSWLETRAGDLRAALAQAEEAGSLARLTGSTSTHAWALTQQALVHAHLGDLEEARRRCEQAAGPVRESGNLLPPLWIAAALALAALTEGDAEAAWEACRPLTEQIEHHGLAEPVTAFFLPEAIEALIMVGEHEHAERLVTLLDERGRALDRVWALAAAARLRGLLEAERGDLNAAAAALELALAHHERSEFSFERARALLARGVVERRAGRRKLARDSIEAARAAFEAMGASAWAERSAAELARVPARRGASGDGLTPAEARTAALVAQGHTNREVARELFVSEKAVEAHLTRVYRKLGIRSRAALAAKLARGDKLPGLVLALSLAAGAGNVGIPL